MTTTTATEDLNARWNLSHDHSRRCWWNWEIGRWICPTRDAPTPTLEPSSTTSPADLTTATTEEQP